MTKFDPNVISNAQIIDVAHLAPNHRATLSANWLSGPWSFNARENYYGWWRDEVDYPGQKFGAKFTTDLDLSYTFMDHFTLTVGANNLFNNHPDKIANSASNPIYVLTGSTADGQVYPRLGGPFGFNGGFWYVRLAAKFGIKSPPPPPPPALAPPPPPATQTCADGSVIDAAAACPAPPPPPAAAAAARSGRARRTRLGPSNAWSTPGEKREGPLRKVRPISCPPTNLDRLTDDHFWRELRLPFPRGSRTWRNG